MDSNIFTEAEHKALKKRLRGDKRDSTGIFSARVKPKIVEILEHWLPLKRGLQKAIKSPKRKKDGK